MLPAAPGIPAGYRVGEPQKGKEIFIGAFMLSSHGLQGPYSPVTRKHIALEIHRVPTCSPSIVLMPMLYCLACNITQPATGVWLHGDS